MKYLKTYERLNEYKVGDYVHLYDNRDVSNIIQNISDNMIGFNRWRITSRRAKITNSNNKIYTVEIIIGSDIISFWIDKDDIEGKLTEWQIEEFELELTTIKYNL
jgi:hypothetical protein